MPRYSNKRPVVVARNLLNGISSCFRKPRCGNVPSRTISITATTEADVVHAIAVCGPPAKLDRPVGGTRAALQPPSSVPSADTWTYTTSSLTGGFAFVRISPAKVAALAHQGAREKEIHEPHVPVAHRLVVDIGDLAVKRLADRPETPDVVNASSMTPST